MKQDNTYLSRSQMEELMPDCVLGKLSTSDREAFGRSLGQYPEMKSELEKAERLFKTLSVTDFDKALSRRTRNLSVRINQQLQAKSQQKHATLIPGLKYWVSALTVAALILIVFKGFNKQEIKYNNNKISPEVVKSLNAEDFKYLKPDETASIISPKLSTDAYMEIASNTIKTIDDPNSELVNPYGKNNGKIIDDLYKEDLTEHAREMGQYLIENATQTNSIKMLDGLEQLKDEDLESILEELENADVNI